MPIPAELQLALDNANELRTDDSTKITTKVDESSEVVKDNIMDLFTQTDPVEKSDLDEGEASELPDLNIVDENSTTESFLNEGDSLPNVKDLDPTSDESENSDLRKMISELSDKISKNDSEKEQDQALQAELDKIAAKYGDADPEMMEQFSDLFKSFRSKMGGEIQADITRSEFKTNRELDQLKAQVKKLIEVKTELKEQKSTNTTDLTHDSYRSVMAEMIPNYSKIIGSDAFKRLMVMPVDKDNPDFKFDNKLGAMFKNRRTDEIVKLFSDVEKKYFSTEKNSPVVDSGADKPNRGDTSTKAKLTPEKLQGILKQVMEGDLTISEQELSGLLKTAAKFKL